MSRDASELAMYDAIFVEPWPWWAAGLGIGLFVLLYAWVYNRVIGMSSSLESSLREINKPLLPDAPQVSSFQAAALALAKARGMDPAAMGIEVPAAASTGSSRGIELIPRIILLGVLIGGLVGGVMQGSTWAFGLGAEFDAVYGGLPMAAQGSMLLLGGVMVGFGARMAGGCPSGHGLGGLSLLSPASFLVVAGWFVAGITVTFAMRALA